MEKPNINKPLIKSPNLFPVVGVGASAGGLDAFKKLLKAIPENSGMAYVLVQHLDPNHESLLADLLQKVTNIPVLEIADDIRVEPDHIYIIPSNKMLLANDGVLELSPRPQNQKTKQNLPIDLFFTSLAEVHQSHAIGVVLSGTANDGTAGLKAIKNYGGITFAQDEESAAYPGMPISAIEAGVVDFILPPDKIPQKIAEVNKSINGNADENQTQQNEDVFKQIIALLRTRKGTDFTYYKQTTIRRRILRRMVINKYSEPLTYLAFLRDNTDEQDLLYQDMLIPVTTFFRDDKTFDNLCENVLPLIVKSKAAGEPIRLWVAGCSTGEEVYSIAICLKELLGDNHDCVQIFGTDLSEPAITKARSGNYTKYEVDNISQQRLNGFFTKTHNSYQLHKSIRDMCVFAVHNFLKNPPFGKMDFISCRNVLIYMEPYLQKKALTTFHYSLNEKGYLLLGKSETTSGVPDLFAPAAKNDKLFTRKDVPGRFMHVATQRSEKVLSRIGTNSKMETIRTDFQKTADDILLSRFTPASVVVNEVMDILHFRGTTSYYLEQTAGKPSHNLLSMAKDGLAFELRNILHKVKKEKVAVIKENIPLLINGTQSHVTIEAIPLPNTIEPYYLVLFHNHFFTQNLTPAKQQQKQVGNNNKDEKDIRILQLEQELAQNREDMRSITEDQEASNEELQSANEELLSSSEEMQSLNEELETNKEELQSTNEELTVVNEEMLSLNEQLIKEKNYAEAIVDTVQKPLLVLDKNLRVKTANSSFYKTFQVSEQDTEGKLIYNIGNRQWNIPELKTLLESILPEKTILKEFEIKHTFLNIGERIMLLNAREMARESNTEKLILLAIEDITEKVIARKKIEESEHRYHEMIYSSPSLISICKGENMIIEIANEAMLQSWGKGNIIGKSVFEAVPESLEQGYDKLLLSVYKTGQPVHAFEAPVTLLRNGIKELVYYNFVYQAQRNINGEIEGVAVIANEVTPQALSNINLKESEERFRSLADNVPIHIFIIEPNAEASISYWNKNWLNYTGQTFEEAIGRAWAGIIHPDDVGPVMDVYIPSFEKRQPYFLADVRIRRHDGEYRWHSVQANPRYLPNGEFIGYIGIGMDIHESKLAQEALQASEKHFRLMADLMPAKISNADATGKVLYFNKHWLDFTGLKFDEIGEFGYNKIIHPDELETFQHRFAKAAETGTVLEMEMRFLDKAGDYIWHLNLASPVKDNDGNITKWVGVTTDITEQINTRNNNLKTYEVHARELEEKVQQRTLELSKANKELAIQNEEKEKRAAELIVANNVLVIESDEKEKKAAELIIANNELVIESSEKEKRAAELIIANEELAFQNREKENRAAELVIANKELVIESEEKEKRAAELIVANEELAFQNREKENRAAELIIANKELVIESEEKEKRAAELIVANEELAFQNREKEKRAAELIIANKKLVIESGEKEKRAAELIVANEELAFQNKEKEKRAAELIIANEELGIQNKEKEKSAAELIIANKELAFQNQEKENRAAELIVANEELLIESFAKEKRSDELTQANIEIQKNYEEHFSQMADLMPDKIATTNTDGLATFFNQNWLDYTGYTINELLGFRWSRIMHPEEIPEIKKRWIHCLNTGNDFDMEMRCLNKNKEYNWFLTRAVPIKDANGVIKSWIGTSTEIQKGKEEQQRKDNFIKMVSHELKTPVTSIKGYVQMLLMILNEKNVELFPMQIKNSLQRVDHQVTRLTRLITEMLDLSRIEAGKLELQQEFFSINALVKETVDDICLTNPKHTINLLSDFVYNIYADRGRIEQVIINLVTNAIKYSANSTNIEVNIRKGEKNMVLVSVRDFGIGIDKADHKKIFDRFFRVEGKVEQTFAGFGIGLYIANEIIVRHNGYITVESEKGRGSVFTFALPYITETNI